MKPAKNPSQRQGLTLIELLVALTVSLIMIFAVVEIFSRVGAKVSDGRATIEMAGEIRSAREMLESDLAGITCPAQVWVDPAAGMGYFEYLEGPLSDSQPSAGDTTLGDIDDVLMFTARSTGEPFTGRFNGTVIESDVAEIVWWLSLADRDGDGNRSTSEYFRLHRRVLLVRPDLNLTGNDEVTFFANNDVSARLSGGSMVANSLGDLTLRENRFAHNRGNFPNALNRNTLQSLVQSGSNLGNDVVLSNVLGFDIKAYDPHAKITADDTANPAAATALTPGDPAYSDYIAGGPPKPPPPQPPLPPPVTIDNADPGFSKIGTWTYHPSSFNGTNGSLEYVFNGSAAQKATWTATITEGKYNIGVSWSYGAADQNRNKSVQYRIYDGSTLVSPQPQPINQNPAPAANMVANGTNYQFIAQNVNFSTSTLRVEVTAGSGLTSADAIRIQKTEHAPQPPPPPPAGNFHVGVGTYVDLNYNNATGTDFSAPAAANSGLGSSNGDNTYDTWSTTHIESAGVDGLDSNGSGTVDSANEYGNRTPPYSVPLRGIEVRIRIMEPDTQKVRQSALQAFLQN
jgi:prepilin-type N-terminal cleavage/methylation domain-containing protein